NVARAVNCKITVAPSFHIVRGYGGLNVPLGFHFDSLCGRNRTAHIQSARRTCKLASEKFSQQRGVESASLVFHVCAGTVHVMNKTVIEVQVRAVLPTSGGCAVFIGNNDKVFIIYVDQTVGSAITMFMRQITKERPLTHDLMGHLMTALGAQVERVIINDLKNATYYARVIIRVENELHQKKIIELDGRPS